MDSLKLVKLSSGFFWGEKDLCGSESLITNQDFSSIRKFVVLLAGMGLFGFVLGGFVIIYNVTHFFLDIFYDFNFGISGEAVSSLIKDFLEVGGDVSTSEVDSLNGMWDGITFIDWHSVGNSISRVQDNTGCSTI